MRPTPTLLLAFLALACSKGDDADQDGFYSDQDCDDEDAGTYPGAPESCDDVDQDCDGEVDEQPEDGGLWYADVDGDGFGAEAYVISSCTEPSGYVDNADDCDDLNLLSYPGAEEWCDGTDNSCDGEIDVGALDVGVYYVDSDGDGYGETGSIPIGACDTPDGYTDNDDDCDDSDGEVNPETYWFGDSDGDGFGGSVFYIQACEQPLNYVGDNDDCDDSDAAVNPDAEEVCDGVDNDCDGDIDDDDDGVVDQTTWYPDGDGDGYGTDEGALTQCFAPSGYADLGADCDDAEAAVYPDALDDCDGLDNDCDGVVDDACPLELDTATYTLSGADNYDYFGYDFRAGGDYDGDGQADLLIGADGQDDGGTSSGSLYVFFGPVTADVVATDADVMVTGGATSDHLGYAVGSAYDLNDDGNDDLIAAAYGADDSGGGEGAAYIWYGPFTSGATLSVSEADANVLGTAANDELGRYLIGGGELSGDGVDDLLIGAHGNDDNASGGGAIYVFNGPVTGAYAAADADTVFYGTSSSDFVGYPAVTDVDFNGDGQADLAFGASGSSGGSGSQEVYLFEGPLAAGTFTGADSDVVVTEYEAGDATGSHVDAGDLDGDGNMDLIIGAKYSDISGLSSGSVHVVYGPLSGTISLASDSDFVAYEASSSSYFGANYNGLAAGDFDGDGVDDLVAGSWVNDDQIRNGGAAFMFFGPVSGSMSTAEADRTFYGSDADEQAGTQVQILDVTGDGVVELLLAGSRSGLSSGRIGMWDDSRL